MSAVRIPSWNAQGLLPPIDVLNPTSATRSPYRVSLTDLILRFNTSSERSAILAGFLQFRAALHGVGFVRGFQWIDGSFLEDIEILESRPPNDVDVVTFYHLPAGQTQATIFAVNPALFNHDNVKASYLVDSYLQDLGAQSEHLVEMSAYWYSVWFHRRSQAWKGYLEVPLDPMNDAAATALLASTPMMGGVP